jgi:Outer membrane protein beta-barrel domain
MKKIVLIASLLVFVLNSQAQNFRFGINASPTWSWIKSDDKLLEGAGANWGFKIGVTGEKYFQENYAFFSGIGFAFNNGGFLQSNYANYRPWLGSDLTVKLDENDTQSLKANSKLHYRLTYVEIPFGLRMRGGSNEDSPLKFYAEAPILTLGILTRALGDINGAGSNLDTQDENIVDDVKRLGLSWGFGAGVEYEFATHTTLVGGLTFQNQFTDITQKARARRTDGEWADEKARVMPRALSLRLGLFF